MKIGLYFGSFNPIHTGHLIIAEYVVSHCDVQQVWLVVSPQNPLKPSSGLLNENHRLQLVRLAINDNLKLKASNIEFKLPRPSYTIDTLTFLKEKHPGYSFSVIVGSDSYQNLKKWKNSELLLKDYNFIVYKRPGFNVIDFQSISTTILDAPLLNISSTKIRSLIKTGKSIRYMVPEEVRIEIENQNFYK
jgi:nicotinate-nucleotide adenylyltransferase